jgi:hypothetical protein
MWDKWEQGSIIARTSEGSYKSARVPDNLKSVAQNFLPATHYKDFHGSEQRKFSDCIPVTSSGYAIRTPRKVFQLMGRVNHECILNTHGEEGKVGIQKTKNKDKGCPCKQFRKGGRVEKQIQENWDNNKKLAVARVLAAIVYLFPPSQFCIIPLIFSKWCSLLPVEETVSHLHHPMSG